MLEEKFRITEGLSSVEPQVKLLAYTQVPAREGLSEEDRKIISDPRVIAGESARTCYSKELATPADYLDEKHGRKTDEVIEDTLASGHHTTREHPNFTFGLSDVSRQFVWSFLHSHPHYNSSQQSQRYVEMKAGDYLVPNLSGRALRIYKQTTDAQIKAYQKLGEILAEPVSEEYFRLFPSRGQHPERWHGAVKKKAQEVARYVLPIATHTELEHTVNALTLMRMARTCAQYDVPTESKIVVAKMVGAVVAEVGEKYLEEIPDPIPLEETPEYNALHDYRAMDVDIRGAKAFITSFDSELYGRTSRLIGWTTPAVPVLAQAVRGVIGLTSYDLDDVNAVALVMDPNKNKLLGEVMNITTMSKLSRAMETISYTFAKRISHTADSQDQRHRMTPAARPVLSAHFTGEPDYVTPALIAATPEALSLYNDIIEQAYDAAFQLVKSGAPFEKAAYLLPNALALRFVEAGTLGNIHHKDKMRLCLSAQEEIWRTTLEEAQQIEAVNPEIGKWLLPPCTIRKLAAKKSYCPEKDRFCGVPVWNLERGQYSRLI